MSMIPAGRTISRCTCELDHWISTCPSWTVKDGSSKKMLHKSRSSWCDEAPISRMAVSSYRGFVSDSRADDSCWSDWSVTLSDPASNESRDPKSSSGAAISCFLFYYCQARRRPSIRVRSSDLRSCCFDLTKRSPDMAGNLNQKNDGTEPHSDCHK